MFLMLDRYNARESLQNPWRSVKTMTGIGCFADETLHHAALVNPDFAFVFYNSCIYHLKIREAMLKDNNNVIIFERRSFF